MKTLILRHRRENLRKCSLSGLETHPDLAFYTYPVDCLPDLSHYVLLKVGAPPLTENDLDKGLLLIDGTWRLTEKMLRSVQIAEERSLPPGFKTAYPRRQTGCSDPESGLSSIEALFVAHLYLNRSTEGLFDQYHWKHEFLRINHDKYIQLSRSH